MDAGSKIEAPNDRVWMWESKNYVSKHYIFESGTHQANKCSESLWQKL